MPIYEYDCPACGQPFEKRMSIAEADKAACPNCGNPTTKRRLSRIAVTLAQGNGSGVSAAPILSSGGT